MATPVTAQQALARLQHLCSRGEKCIADLRTKLTAWEIPITEADEIIKALVEAKFVDEQRYAVAFVRDKSRFARWGALKIQMGLKAKRIPPNIIAVAMEELDSETYESDLKTILQKKIGTIKAKSDADLMAKLVRFALSRGYEYDLVYSTASKLIKEKRRQ